MIFTDRTITVRKGESRIDEPIVVYRGDYELEVRFTILNSRFKFMSGTNMIESEKASYGQLAILTPYGGNIFSDVVRCNDGSVTFVLTVDMLNQIEEVGLYSFQIRLMDFNKESRVSIPPIEFGIEVREPIASEDHDNSVNNAIVGYSIAKVVDPKEENVSDTFDESGNYNKTNWETGDRISEGKLNKIEDAIDKINENEVNNTAVLSKRIDNNFNVLDSIKAESSDMANIQLQVNDLVLGATGDGNNAEVVQSRAGYTLLNDRLTVISEAATKCDKFGYIDLSNPDFLDTTYNRIVCNCIPITSKGSVVVKYVPRNSYVFIQHLRYNSNNGVFKILSSIRVNSTKDALNTAVCNFKIDPSGYDYIAVEGLGFSRNLSNPGYMFLSDSYFESDQSQTEYVKTHITVNPEASFAYYVEVYSINDTELKQEIDEVDNEIKQELNNLIDTLSSERVYGYVDLNDPSFENSCRMVTNGIPITSNGDVTVTFKSGRTTVYIQHVRYDGVGRFDIIKTIKVNTVVGEIKSVKCDFNFNVSGYDYIAVDGAQVSDEINIGYCILLSSGNYNENLGITSYDTKLSVSKISSISFYVSVNSMITPKDLDLISDEMDILSDDIDNIANRVSDIESQYLYVAGYERDTVDVNMLSGGFWNQGKVSVDKNANWDGFFYIDTPIIVKPGEIYHIKNIVGTANLHPILLAKSGYTEWVYVYPSSEPITGTVPYDEIVLTIPDGVDRMYLNTAGNSENIQNLSIEKAINVEYKFKEIPENQIELNEDMLSRIDNIENNYKYAIYNTEKLSVNMLSGGFWNQSKAVVEKKDTWGSFFYSESKMTVAPGETYRIKNIVGTSNLHPILLGNNSFAAWVYVYPSSEPITGTVTYDEILLTIPDGVDFMCLNTTGSSTSIQNLSIEKVLNIEYKFKEIPENQIELNDDMLSRISELEFETNSLRSKCTKYDNFEFTWKSFDKVYFAITIDDSNSALGDFYDVAHSRGIPISTACVASKLNSGVSGDRTIREVNNLIVADGGEILAHYSGSPTDDTSYEDWLKLTRTPKKILMEEGWVVRGLIRADSTPWSTSKGERVCREYYDYSDNVGKSAQYNMGSRKFLIGVETLDEFKTWVDTCCNTPGFYPICVHGLRDDEPLATKENLALILDYISSKNNTVFTTYAEMFDKFGTTTIEKKIDLL